MSDDAAQVKSLRKAHRAMEHANVTLRVENTELLKSIDRLPYHPTDRVAGILKENERLRERIKHIANPRNQFAAAEKRDG